MNYEEKVLREMEKWKLELSSKQNMFQRLSKNAQNKVNSLIPEKVHHFITESIKKMVQATLAGSNITTKKRDDIESLTLEEKEKLVLEKLDKFKRTAAAEGAGTGAGGILLGLADFPLLLSIKIKFLFEACSLYGFDPKKYEERLFLLYIFQLAFSSEEHRKEVITIIENWESEVEERKELDWRALQQEYRDFLDLVKLFQMVPGFGAVVGAYANFNLLDQLGKTAMNCYRMRIINKTRK